MSINEAMDIFRESKHKKHDELTVEEKAVMADVAWDAYVGRYSPLLNASLEELHKFLNWVKAHGSAYSELEDGERWAVEDVYFDKV